jgi:hypothetical protein
MIRHSLQCSLTHETSRVGAVSADLSVNLDETLHKDVLDFLAVQSVLKTVTQEDDERKTLAGLVGTSAWLGSISACVSFSVSLSSSKIAEEQGVRL